MKIGFVYPQTEFGNDPIAIRDLAQSADELGFSHVLAYDHVVGVNPKRPEAWVGPYDYQTPFQSPLLLFSYMAAVTTRLGFATGILILPQRQTALVAKQAATLDVLSKGRLRLGVGVGWNKPEYTALGNNFHDRGRRIEEQVQILRALWTDPLVKFSGKWHNIPDAGINPLPIQQPIPIWFGGHADAVLQRAAQLGDGWLPNYRSGEEARPALAKIGGYLEQAGRDGSGFGVEARIHYADGNPIHWERLLEGWQGVGASHISFNTMQAGLDSPAKHLKALRLISSSLDIKHH
ncbi:MAG: LLM class F420-dependent oxidoreductase [Anaerolineales bacterium]